MKGFSSICGSMDVSIRMPVVLIEVIQLGVLKRLFRKDASIMVWLVSDLSRGQSVEDKVSELGKARK